MGQPHLTMGQPKLMGHGFRSAETIIGVLFGDKLVVTNDWVCYLCSGLMAKGILSPKSRGELIEFFLLHWPTQKKTPKQQLPVLFLQTLLYTILVSVSPGFKFFLQKTVFKLRKSSYLAFLKSKR